ncbi:hypothetical protein BU24DRAFT_427300 [Aaosphaeria arxii CBS 175.79]|uniref:Uncharacterized protein n=1 Tax=Aaosphaeria arxii CBS 175.79 TaxID=1450172 RepID=A0A6A5XE00_9PLEO|nr:uncharacterized protein BU24DRAFT_427300 [Aaosphaeria arxii CBS 175.79]KAF2011091.1 hypothetical protein BU24DRAFT_427300 [Aaosphaeria arxii CBS 175.79]
MTDYTIYTTPAMTAPDGGQSDLINANSQHPHLIATAATCLALSFIFLASRLFTKAYLLKTLDLEDCKYTNRLTVQLLTV